MDREQIQNFEHEIDRELKQRKLFLIDPVSAITQCAGILSVAYSESSKFYGLAQELRRGFNVALEYLISLDTGIPLDPSHGKTIVADLAFMSHYYTLREYLYFTYNVPDSFIWEQNADSMTIRFNDDSIPRQFMQTGNSDSLASDHLAEQVSFLNAESARLLRGHEEFGMCDHIDEIYGLTSRAADAKLAQYFELLRDVKPTVEFHGGYNYDIFYKVYRHLMIKALYHRAWAIANSTWATFQFPKNDLVQEIMLATELSEPAVESVLGDLSYSRDTQKLRPMYFDIIDHHMSDKYIMLPQHFASSDGLVQMLRVQALTAPNWFSGKISNAIGNCFAKRVSGGFADAGFFAKRNVRLTHLDPKAPDIDVFIVSRELTLGYVIFVCEVKAVLPAIWAKDHLRVLRRDSIPKAFEQVRHVIRLLSSAAGKEFLVSEILSLDPDPIPDSVVVVRPLIVTPHNTGMFFTKESREAWIVDYPTLFHILRNCDGDVVYVLQMLSTLPEVFGSPEIIQLDLTIGGRGVKYDVVTATSIIPFPKNYWKSTGLDIQVAEDFYHEGGSPLDVLGGREGLQSE